MKLIDQQKRINLFSRFLIRSELRNRKRGKPGFNQEWREHRCGTPACVGGYLDTYPPYLRWLRAQNLYWPSWRLFTGLDWDKNFYHQAGGGAKRTAFQAANTMRREVGLKPFKSVREALKR